MVATKGKTLPEKKGAIRMKYRKILSVLLAAALLAALFGACTSPMEALRGLFSKEDRDGGMPFEGLDLDKYIDLGEYKGVTADFRPELTDETAEYVAQNYFAGMDPENLDPEYLETLGYSEEQIEELTEESKKYFDMVFDEETERTAVVLGDAVRFDYEGSARGATAEDLKGMKGTTTLVIGSGGFIDGFEEQIIGKSKGKPFSVEVTFPDPYTNSMTLAGKPAVFVCTVHKIYVGKTIPDEAAAYLTEGQIATTRELLDYLNEQIARSNAPLALETAMDGAQYLRNLPKKEAEFYLEMYKGLAKEAGQSLKKYLESNKYTEGVKAFKAEFNDTPMRQDLFVFAVAEKEGLEATDDDWQEWLESIRYQTGNTYSSDDELIAGYGGKDVVVRSVMANVVAKFLYDNAVKTVA